MFLYRKNIILVPSDYDGISLTKGLLSLDCFDSKTKCTLRCYNLNEEKPLLLGIAVGKELQKIEVSPKNAKNLQFEMPISINNNEDISCVMINLHDQSYDIVLWGSTQISNGWKMSLELMLEDQRFVPSAPTKDVPKTSPVDLSPKQSENVEAECNKKTFFATGIDEPAYCPNSADILQKADEKMQKEQFGTCSHAEAFCAKQSTNQRQDAPTLDDKCKFATSNNFGQSENFCDNSKNQSVGQCDASAFNSNKNVDEMFVDDQAKLDAYIDSVIDMTESKAPSVESMQGDAQNKTFFERLSPQIDKMFEQNKPEDVLSEIIPNSKFCRVSFDDKSGYYVFGVINENGAPKYLCYGIPAKKESQPPADFANLYQWLPIDVSAQDGDGFYMMYQDASTGDNISVEVI